jgi:DNA-directed RNA polymerase specialized sigma24 family protein
MCALRRIARAKLREFGRNVPDSRASQLIDSTAAPIRSVWASGREFADLIDAHGRAMYRVAISTVRDPAMAEDVVQDAIIKVWDSISTYRGDAPIRNWILRITHNTAVSSLRKVRDEAWDPAALPEGEAWDNVERSAEARDDLGDC